MPAHPQRFWLAALLVAWSADFLFWNKPIGVSLVVFIMLLIASFAWSVWSEDVRPAWSAPVLVVAALLGAIITVWRAEPLTRFLNGVLAFGMLGLLVISLRKDQWLQFGVLDYLIAGVTAFGGSLTRGAGLPLLPKPAAEAVGNAANPAMKAAGPALRAARSGAPVLRGILLAVPVLFVFGGLLAAADPIFNDALADIFSLIDLKRLPEYLLRLVNIFILAYLFVGALLHAVLPEESSAKRPLAAGVSRFLGSTEAFIVLGSLNLLFAAFVAVQFRYFFGGQANITAAGYTYSEYARRGFFELVTVAVLSLGLIAVMGAITRRSQPGQFRIFTGLSALLVILVWVMLVSAFQRLQLYEEAYGFTRLRTYTHLFIPWLGALLLVTVLLQVIKREMYFLLTVLLAVVGFTFTLGLVNVDGMIADLNIRRAAQGADLDAPYLLSLSDDALPILIDRYNSPSARAAAANDKIGAVLACRIARLNDQREIPWQGYHPGMTAARSRLAGLDLSAYKVRKSLYGGYEVEYGPGGLLNCSETVFID